MTGYFFLRSCSQLPHGTPPLSRISHGYVAAHASQVFNRENGGAAVLHKNGGYAVFLDLLHKDHRLKSTLSPFPLLGMVLGVHSQPVFVGDHAA